MKKKYTFIDLFAGCGGLSLGLEQAGFEVVFMNEIAGIINNPLPISHRKTLTRRPSTDQSNWFIRILEKIIDDPRNQLYKAYLQFLSEVRPQFFIMENVKGM